MSSTDDIARLLNLGGADSTALAEVITDYFWDGGAVPFEDSGLFYILSNRTVYTAYISPIPSRV